MLKLAILWPRSLSSKIISWFWFLLARNLWAVIKIHLNTLDLCWPLSVIVSRSFITYLTDQLETSNWANPNSNFFLGGMFIAPRGIVFWFLPWPWPLLSRSSRESVFHLNGFFPYFVQSTRGILVKRVRKLHRQVAHDLIIVHLQLTYFRKYCVVLKLPILWPKVGHLAAKL